MQTEIKTNPKYTQPENSYVTPPTQIQSPSVPKNAETIDLTNKAISNAAPVKTKSSIYDIDPNSLANVNVSSSPFGKTPEIVLTGDIGEKVAPKAKKSDYDADPKKVAAELKEKKMTEAIKNEDLSFLRKG